MEKKYRGVMFDMDGTLLDTLDDMQTAVNLTMSEFGCPLHTREDIRSYINNGAFMLIKRALPESMRDDETVKRVLSRYVELYAEHVCEKTYPYDGTSELLKKLKAEGYSLAVVSNKPDACVKILAEKIYGADAFVYVSGSGLGLPSKPDRECVDRGLRAMGVDRKRLLYVGDSCVDVDTARNAETDCAGVTWGFHGKAGFLDRVPDFYADNTSELYRLITKTEI